MELIRLEEIEKTYLTGTVAVPVLRGISLAVDHGEYVALMGSSGSGKSTLMNILGFLDRPSSGRYILEGKDITRLPPDDRARLRNQKIGFVFQSFNLLPRTSALENVLMPLTYAHPPVPDDEAYSRARMLLERVGLGARLDHEPAQLSGGQQQRVAIARSLINSPSILLADEPTGNLDSHTTEEMLDLFRELNEKEGITIILVTHEADVGHRAKRIVRLHDGVIQSDMTQAQGSVERMAP